ISASYGAFHLALPPDRALMLYNVSAIPAALGGVMTIVGGVSLVGEAIARATFRDDESLDAAALSGDASASTPAATAVQSVMIGESSGAVATLARPSVSEMRA